METPGRSSSPSYCFDDVTVDLENFRVLKEGEPRALEPRAFNLLVYLIQNRGRVVEKQELFEQVWKETFVTDNALTRAIKQIRRATGDDAAAPRHIETIPKRGYRFSAELKPVPVKPPEVIEPSMQKQPGNRHQTAREPLQDPEELSQSSQSVGAAIRRAVFGGRPGVRVFGYAAAAVIFLVGAGLAVQSILRLGSSRTVISSLVVLPFTNGNTDASSEYLSDGLTESIINSLSQLSKLKVMARTTAFRYKGKDADPQAVGRELKVEGVLTGRVLQQGDSLLVQADLVNAADGAQLWGEKYSRKMSDILAVQEEIATQISNRLRLKLSGEEEKRLTKSYTANTEAYQLYLKGRYYWNKRTEDSYQKAIEFFKQAIDRDPNYALAYTGLADSYSFLSSQGIRAPRDVFPLAKEAAAKAIELDEALSEAHTSSAYVKLYYDWDWAGAEQEYSRAIKLNPNYATPHHGFAYLLISTGRAEQAIAEIERAEEIDPLSLIINTDHGEFYYFLHRTGDAIRQLQKAIDLDTSFVRAHFLLARAYAQNGQCNDAIAEFQKAKSLGGGVEMMGALAQGYASCGMTAETNKAIDELLALSKDRYVSPHWVAAAYAGLHETDKAFDWIDKAFDARFGPLIYLKVNPIWDPMRTDPRFADRLKRVGLTP